jgi:ferredoxin
MGYTLNIVHGAVTESQDVADTVPLLHSLDRLMTSPIQVGCKGGGCGVCKVRVVAGSYTSKPMSKAHITEKEKAAGIVLACRIIPTSNLTVLPMGNTQNLNKL